MRFLLILLLYGGVQFYIAMTGFRAFGIDAGWAAALMFSVAVTLAPFLHRRVERCQRCPRLASASAWLVFGWMGFSFLLFWVALAFALYDGVARAGALPAPDTQTQALAALLLAAALWLAGWWSARHPRIDRVTLVSSKLAAGSRLRLAQISDVHLGVLIGRRRLAALLARIEALDPDVLVSTGDLVDAEAHHLRGLAAAFARYSPRLGKYAITGNHEAYAGLAHALDFHRDAGFTLLRGSAATVGAITLAGVDDPATHAGHIDEVALLDAIAPERLVVLLKHQPVVHAHSRFDLQLSGHTHKGQIFPFGLLVKTVYPMIAGRYALSHERTLYVNRGTGTWGPPIRLLAPAEITLIELRGAA